MSSVAPSPAAPYCRTLRTPSGRNIIPRVSLVAVGAMIADGAAVAGGRFAVAGRGSVAVVAGAVGASVEVVGTPSGAVVAVASALDPPHAASAADAASADTSVRTRRRESVVRVGDVVWIMRTSAFFP